MKSPVLYPAPVFRKRPSRVIPVSEPKPGWKNLYKAKYAKHSPEILHRSFPSRHSDSDMLIMYLNGTLNCDLKASERYLADELFLQGEHSRVHYFGIGEGLCNSDPLLNYQGIPAPSFQETKVLLGTTNCAYYLVDLDSEVRRFKSHYIEREHQRALLRNTRLLSTDGKMPFKEVVLRADVQFPHSDTVVLRIVNSMDIYQPFNVCQRYLSSMSKFLVNNPVLVFFNRYILFKPVGSTTLRCVGWLSPRGFNANNRRLDSEGEPSFTVLSKRNWIPFS